MGCEGGKAVPAAWYLLEVFIMRHYNLKLDEFDPRDVYYNKSKKDRPVKVDLRKYCSAIEDQGRIGSCTANALVGNLEFLEKADGDQVVDLSRLFIYYINRFLKTSQIH